MAHVRVVLLPWLWALAGGAAPQHAQAQTQPPQHETTIVHLVMPLFGGDEVWDSPILPLFVASAGAARGIALTLVGDAAPPYAPPATVRHVPASWPSFAARLEAVAGRRFADLPRSLDAAGIGNLTGWSAAHLNAISGYKPFVRLLYPEVFEGVAARWVGWTDCDVLVGTALADLAAAADAAGAQLVAPADEGPGSRPRKLSWGPLTLLRAAAYDAAVAPALRDYLGRASTPAPRETFDEWGKKRWGGAGLEHSFSGILAPLVERGAVATFRPPLDPNAPPLFDACCQKALQHLPQCKDLRDLVRSETCGYCRFDGGGRLFGPAGDEYFLCHFQFAKRRWKNATVADALRMASGAFVTPRHGVWFRSVDAPTDAAASEAAASVSKAPSSKETVVLWHAGPRVTAWHRSVLERYGAFELSVLRDVTGLRPGGVRLLRNEPLRDYETNETAGRAVDVCEVTWDAITEAEFGAEAARALGREVANPRKPGETFRVVPHHYHGLYQLLWWRHCSGRPARAWFVENDAAFLGDAARFFAAADASADLVAGGFRIAGEHWWQWPLAVATIGGADPVVARRNATSPVANVDALLGLSTGGCTDHQRIPDDEAGLLFRQDHVERLSAALLDALDAAFAERGFALPNEAWAPSLCASLETCTIYDFAPLSADARRGRGDWVTSSYCWWAPPGFFFSRRPHCRRGAVAPDFADRWVHPVKTTCASALSCEPADRSDEGAACLFPQNFKPSDGEWARSGYDDATRRRFEGAFPTKKKTSRGAPSLVHTRN